MTAIGTCTTCGTTYTRPTPQHAADDLWACDTHHRNNGQASIHQLPQVTFREQALAAIRALAITGRPFTIGDAHPMVNVAPINPRTEWPAVTREARDLGWIIEHGYAPSVVPSTRSSAVKVWQGTATALRAVS